MSTQYSKPTDTDSVEELIRPTDEGHEDADPYWRAAAELWIEACLRSELGLSQSERVSPQAPTGSDSGTQSASAKPNDHAS
jgi:hypothetical protein